MTPQQYPDFAALRGDPSDNLPGIPGVGEKTATKWINQFGSFADLVERADEVKGKAGQNLRDHLESVKLNRRAHRDGARRGAAQGPSRTWSARRTTATALAVVLDALEIRNPTLRERLLAVDPGADEEGARRPAPRRWSSTARCWRRASWPPWLAEHGDAAARRGHGRHLGAGHRAASPRSRLPPPGGAAAWFDPTQLDEADEQAFAAWLADADRPKVMHNAKDAMRVFAEHGWSVDGVSMDTALAAYLVKPGRRSFALDALSLEYLGRELAPAAAADGQLAFGADEQAEARGSDGAGPHRPRPGRGVRRAAGGGRRRRAAARDGAADLRAAGPHGARTASLRTAPIWRAWSSSSRAPCSRR